MTAREELVEDHVHVHETVVPGPHGQHLAALSVDEDVVVRERLKKGEADAVAKASLSVPVDPPTTGSIAEPVAPRVKRKSGWWAYRKAVWDWLILE
ncbi:uncharacterized protein LOC122049487 [Zingiber officinale]|nr:uncharacterized protein LOC122049487 [Zingiber officinale]